MTETSARVGMGVRPWADPSLDDHFEEVALEIDAREPHWYAVTWTPDRVDFYVDERRVKTVEQAPDYPMQFMLSFYEFAEGPAPASPPDRYPKTAVPRLAARHRGECPAGRVPDSLTAARRTLVGWMTTCRPSRSAGSSRDRPDRCGR